MRVVILGASGGHGRALGERLKASGHEVRGFVRDPARAPDFLDEVVVGEAISGRGLDAAMDGADVAYSFLHALEPGRGSADARDVAAATETAKAARATGLERLVKFSIYMPPAGRRPTAYQANRRAVERVLLDGFAGTVVVRSGISVGPGLRGIRPYLRLAQRSPVIPLGPWRSNIAAVVDVGTEIDCLIAAGVQDGLAGGVWDVPPSAEPTHEELVRVVIDVLGVRRAIVKLPASSARLDARLIATITGEDRELCDYLVGVARTDYRADPRLTTPFKGMEPISMRQALSHAVAEWRDLPRYQAKPDPALEMSA